MMTNMSTINSPDARNIPREVTKKGWKTILVVFGVAALAYGLPIVFNYIATAASTSFNPRNPSLYQYETTLWYAYENGTRGATGSLELDISQVEGSPRATVTATMCTTGTDSGPGTTATHVVTYEAETETGRLVNGSRYTLFWVFTLNNLLDPAGVLLEEREMDVVDPVGLLGAAGANYTLVFDRKWNYWVVPKLLFGAQYSFLVDIYDVNDQKVGVATYDSTSGLLELVEGRVGLSLEDPGIYPMSRHRLTIMWAALVAVVAVPAATYGVLRKKCVDPRVRGDLTLLVTLGSVAEFVDFILDVWIYAYIGIPVMTGLHVALVAAFIVACRRLEVHPLWVTPMLLEVGFAIGLFVHTAVPFYPSLTVGLGTFLSYLCILYRVGEDRPLL